MTRSEVSDNITQLVEEAEQVGIDPEEIKVRFLYSKGLLFDLTIKEFAILASLCPDTVYRNKTKFGFGENNRTSIYNLRYYLSGSRSQGDARLNIANKRKMSSPNVEQKGDSRTAGERRLKDEHSCL